MNALLLLVPVALGLGLLGLAAFLWSLRTGQFDDIEGARHRILDGDEDGPIDKTPPNGERPRD